MAVNDRLTMAKQRLEAYYKAEIAVLSSQEYKIGTNTLTRADLSEIRKTIKELENMVSELEAVAAGKGHRRAYRITPRDL